MNQAPRHRIERGKDSTLNETQKALQELADFVNQTPLRFPHLPRFAVNVFDLNWVAGTAALTRVPFYHAREPGFLGAAAFTAQSALAPNGTNYRSFLIERLRNGVYTKVAYADTTEKGLVANTPFEFAPFGEQEVLVQEGDVFVLTIDGGGTKPAITTGLLDVYVEKDDP